ncbi:hypothetical protein GV794_23840 [Nocardia cyriacigeorgica]|uniref:Uncharacterized protein n=1 Tax=Nocardia cyriacigeorgica TaxID=135487 RepID=A0A6P1CYK5_9NOCA|nr:hypothetical protein [Nocardia cyriacigeorgica]NEW36862.1 hypothetical protein [Nocardia cyriacigeorgica]NEW39790.1 hypothetical protein [Nocardia cyriacigeorgica]NEW45517.1 hypothetical protein [Nocardia cyriacigeorgica]NEW52424.1 hypothetical protein [Nocardia cyriacigeorgica]NEW58653.1 hypothetical protein [Nocardia cyriacigeorgica]
MPHSIYVQADGRLAEHMCRVHLLDLTLPRARQLLDVHRRHLPDDCMVHLAAAVLLFAEDDD